MSRARRIDYRIFNEFGESMEKGVVEDANVMDSEDVSTNNIAGTRTESEVELEMMTDEQIEAKLAVIEKEVERKKKMLKLREAMQENNDLSERMKRPRKDRDVDFPDGPQRVGVSGPRGTEEDSGPLTTVRNVNIRDLRRDTRLQDSATRALADLGLPDSDAGWGETQDSSEDSSDGLSRQRKSGKGKKKRTRKHKNSNKYNNWCKASKLIAPALTTIWSQIFKMGSWKKKQQCKIAYCVISVLLLS